MTFTPEQNPRIQLNSGQQIPQLGLGVYKVGQDIGVELVKAAIEVGYRRIDTAALYDNGSQTALSCALLGTMRCTITELS